MMRRFSSQSRRQLDTLVAWEVESSQAAEVVPPLEPELLVSRLGRAGHLTVEAQSRARQKGICILLAVLTSVAALALLRSWSVVALSVLVVTTTYGLACSYLLLIRAQVGAYERALRFYLPLTIEQLILLVQSGLGPVPAIQAVLKGDRGNPVLPYLQYAYQQAETGVPFEKALSELAASVPAIPLRHFLLHLETAIAEGASLANSLRHLGDQVHSEWQITLEGSVRRLESLVVVPVFLAVIGLLLLVAAVPIVPLIELGSTMEHSQLKRPAGLYAQ